ncbi:MAG: PAS domain S-box protein, partial [Candidatus Omnitrophica bacterium]|nr:PAS domain S-box protein [Candidatus Omnitrophota bacterium]
MWDIVLIWIEILLILLAFAAGFFLAKKSVAKLESAIQTAARQIQAEKTREAGLEAEKTQLNAILENMAEGILAVDSQTRILVANPSAEKIFKKNSDELLGKPVLEAIKNPALDSMIRSVLGRPQVMCEEIELRREEGKTIKVSAIGLEPRARGVAGILVLYDVTELVRLENLRRDFVANVSHELRTPLTSIKGFLETLLAGAMRSPDRALDFLERMDQDVSRLGRLI